MLLLSSTALFFFSRSWCLSDSLSLLQAVFPNLSIRSCQVKERVIISGEKKCNLNTDTGIQPLSRPMLCKGYPQPDFPSVLQAFISLQQATEKSSKIGLSFATRLVCTVQTACPDAMPLYLI